MPSGLLTVSFGLVSDFMRCNIDRLQCALTGQSHSVAPRIFDAPVIQLLPIALVMLGRGHSQAINNRGCSTSRIQTSIPVALTAIRSAKVLPLNTPKKCNVSLCIDRIVINLTRTLAPH